MQCLELGGRFLGGLLSELDANGGNRNVRVRAGWDPQGEIGKRLMTFE